MFVALIIFAMVIGGSIATAMANESAKIENEYERSKRDVSNKSWL